MDNPIWKPYQISIGLEASQSVLFRVRLRQNPGGQILFTGRAYAKTPDAGEVKVVLNDIFANYVSMPFPQIVAGVHQFSKGGTMGFFVEAQENGQNWSAVESVFFSADWSYDDAKAWVDGKPLTTVAGRQVSVNQYLFITVVECFGVKIHGTRKDGSTYVVSSTIFTTESTGTAAFRLSDFASEGDVLQVYCVVDGSNFDGSDFNMDFSNDFGGEVDGEVATDLVFEVGGCYRYTLHWVNERGGWMQTPLAAVKWGQDIERTLLDGEASVEVIRNGITKRATICSPLMSDEESAAFADVVSSTNVVLYDSEKDTWIPVVVTDTTMEIQKYRTNGAKMSKYTLAVQVAEKFERK